MRALLCFSMALSAKSADASNKFDDLKRRIDEKVIKHFQNNSQVGVVVGVVKNGETRVWSYGERVRGSFEAPTGETFFEMGSITKTFTASLLALEVVRGRVKLSDKVKSLWRELDGTEAGEITLEQLATHQSGLPRMPYNFAPSDPLNPYKDYDETKLFSFLKSFKRDRPAPAPYSYSNLGFGLLGYLLAVKHHAEDFESSLEQKLLLPLGLKDTRVRLDEDDLRRTAQGYGNFFEVIPLWDLNALEGAGVLKTTVNDLLKYMKFAMNHDDSELAKAIALTLQPRALADDAETNVGLAWHRLKLGDYSVAAHSGGTGGYRANLVFDQSKQVGAVVLSNSDMSPSCVLAPVFDVECEVPDWKKVSPELQAKLVGPFYSEVLKLHIDVFLEGGLLGIHPHGQSKARLWATSDLEYQIPVAEATLRFMDNGFGDFERFVLTQNGQSFEFARPRSTGSPISFR